MESPFFEEALALYRTNSKRYRNWSRAYWRLSSPGESVINCDPLRMCIYNGHVRILKSILSNLDEDELSGKVNYANASGNTALHYASKYGCAGATIILFNAKADPGIRNKAGLTALHEAIESNEPEIITALINGGINIDIKTTGEDSGRTALHLAADAGLQSMVELLVEKHSANIEIYDSKLLTAADRAFHEGHGQIQHFLITNGDNSGITELDRAIIEGDTDLVRCLISAGTSLSTTDNRGLTPLHRAARGDSKEILKLLLKNIATPDIQYDDGMTPLHVASRYDRLEAVEILLERGACVDAASEDSSTPLHEAALGGNYRIVKRLHDANADLTSLDGKHRTPLFCASELGFDSVIDYLLRQQPESAGVNKDEGRLPIHAAAKNGHRKAVERLMVIDKGAMEKQDCSGSTPLSLAVSVNSVSHT